MVHLNATYIAQLDQAAKAQFKDGQGIAFGPYILGFALEGVFFGMLMVQFWNWYHSSFKTDRTAIRLLVFYLFLISIVYTVMISVFIFWLFAYGYGVYWKFYNFDWITTFFMLVSLTQTPVSFYFVHRAYKLWGNSKVLAIAMSTLLTVSFAICIALKVVSPYIIQVAEFNNVSESQELYTELFLVIWLGCAMLTDIMVTVSISWALLRTRMGFQGFERTNKIIKRLIRLSMEAQLIPTVFTAGFLIAFAAFPTTNLSAFFLCTPKVYALALMVVLNSREKLQAHFSTVGQLPEDDKSSPQLRNRSAQNQTEIHVHTDIISEVYQLTPTPVKRSINRDPPEPIGRRTRTPTSDTIPKFPIADDDHVSFLDALLGSPAVATSATQTSPVISNRRRSVLGDSFEKER